VFFYDRSKEIPEDPILHQLLCHSKTLVTPHQGFATNEALQAIISTTFENLNAWEAGKDSAYELS
jgi:D-lactate dehydrogenase